MSEIECQVYLKQALESEDFETASKIREQMKKYR
jgi:protein-arginine kinase activator protein McsA